jgi:heat shock protein HtpX
LRLGAIRPINTPMGGHERNHSPRDVALLVLAFLLTGVAVVVAMGTEELGGYPRLIGTAVIAAIVTTAIARGVRLYRAGATAAIPTAVARVAVRARPTLGISLLTVGLALVLPLALGIALLALTEAAWLPIAAIVLLGCASVVAAPVFERREYWYTVSAEGAEGLLERLCMRADLPTPELVVHYGGPAYAWTVGGRIHLTRRLLKLLDDAELEAVLAHEVAHLAHRDAAVMEICSAPSRVLLEFLSVLVHWVRGLVRHRTLASAGVLFMLTLFCAPPSIVLGWISRLSVLGLSRAREFAADAAAAALTGRPSALASALMKLDGQRQWSPGEDLRQVEALATLGIVGTARSRLGRLFSTHPPVAERVRRLEATETRIQAGPYR